jgi:transposase
MSPPPNAPEDAFAENARLRERVRQLEELVARLEARLNRNSRNSSKPPSSDFPRVKLPPKKTPSGRKPGGQPGHKGSRRELLTSEEVDEVNHYYSEKCEKCGKALAAENESQDIPPLRHQVIEIPPARAHVSEHQLHTRCCAGCRHATTAQLPVGIPAGNFGPRLQATIALFTGAYRVSKRTTMQALSDLFSVRLSLGSVSASEQVMSQALECPVVEARDHVQRQGIVHADETGWRERRKRAWLWFAGTAMVATFMVHLKRGAEAARAILGNFSGILVTDRWNGYNEWALKDRQFCWAHLLRDFTFISQSKGTAAKVGKALVEQTKKLFRNWYKVRDGTMTREGFARSAGRLRREIERQLKRGAGCEAPKVFGMCVEILKVYDGLWTFVTEVGVEPTNNFAERNLRAAVLWRKGSFGTHSEEGSRFVERMLTTVATLRLQGRNVFDFLVEASEAHLHGRPAPSLLPARS